MIAAGCGNELIAELLGRLHTHLHIFRLRFHNEVTRDAFAEHMLILQLLSARSRGAAEGAMRDRYWRSYERLINFTEE